MTLSISDLFRSGWTTFKKRPWFLIGVFVGLFIISALINASLEQLFPSNGPITFLSLIATFGSIVIGALIEMTLVRTTLRAHESLETMRLHDTWSPTHFLSYIIAQVAVGIAVLIGLVLLIIPGLIIAAAFLFTPYLIMDKGYGPFEAMAASRRMTEGHRVRLILLMFAIVLFNLVGALALGVGLFITVPVSMLAVTHAYRMLEQAATPAT